ANQKRCSQRRPGPCRKPWLALWRFADAGHDAAAKIGGRHIVGKVRTQARAERAPPFDLSSQARLLGQALLEAGGLDRRKLAVDIGVEEKLVLFGDAHLSLSCKAPRINLRAPASRGITVPMGVLMTSAMAPYSRSAIS